MSEHVPAWKRIGLKVKQELEADPLDFTTHLDSGKVTAKQTKLLNKKKRQAKSSDGENSDLKPPKRQKLPKSERPPPPEKDQLVYLRTYTTDRDNWKFSKQKQNWILKHIKVIEDKYEDYLINYLEGLQGGSRDRLVEDMKKIVESWNKAADETPKEEQKSSETSEAKEEKDVEGSKDSKAKETKNELESVDSDYALRARKIIQKITEEKLELKGIDDEERLQDKQEDEEKDEEKDNSDISNRESKENLSESESASTSKSSDVSEDSSSESNASEESGKPSEKEEIEDEKTTEGHSNLIVEQVEVTDFINENDYNDEPEIPKKAEKDVKTESSDKEKKKKKNKDKKRDKKKEHKNQDKSEK